jgi:hypothetical protein
MSRPFKLYVLPIVTAVSMMALAPAASADDWTPWYSIQDGYMDRIDVRYRRSALKASDGRGDVNYQFRNRYADAVELKFKVIINQGEVAADSQVQMDARDGTSFEGAYVHNAREIAVKVDDLRRAGSMVLLPRAE